jgi:hypothetical protein
MRLKEVTVGYQMHIQQLPSQALRVNPVPEPFSFVSSLFLDSNNNDYISIPQLVHGGLLV